MFFNSFSYLLFFPAVAAILFVVPSRLQWPWLLLSSIVFYYTLLPSYVLLFIVLILLNYFFGLLIQARKGKNRLIFILGLSLNICVLAFFKYFRFISFDPGSLFMNPSDFTFAKLIVPAGLSYFIFTLLSYLIEVKRGTIEPESHMGVFATSLLFFPKILQGPIERPANLFHQFRERKRFDYDRITDGLKMMLWGYFKKIVVADRLAVFVNAVYGNPQNHNGTSIAIATLFYTIQIYADFSGYTDIALGSAKVLGFNLTPNFNRPYFSTSVKDFWNRWHISFSTWLRDYIFLPLAYFFSGNMKKEKYLTIAAEKWIFLFSALLTFAVCGLWHGEGLHYLVWGLLFGVYLSFSNWTLKPFRRLKKKLHLDPGSRSFISLKILSTFLLVAFTWIFFRASSVSDAGLMIRKIFTQQGIPYMPPDNFIYCSTGFLILFLAEFSSEFMNGRFRFMNHKKPWIRLAAVSCLVISILLFGVLDGGQFVYFQF
jgi:alginate O-acetyltransferase complex protein AlgI